MYICIYIRTYLCLCVCTVCVDSVLGPYPLIYVCVCVCLKELMYVHACIIFVLYVCTYVCIVRMSIRISKDVK